MPSILRTLVRYGAYPLIAGGVAALLAALASAGVSYWPVFPLIVASAIACVALLERVAPFENA